MANFLKNAVTTTLSPTDLD